MLLPRYAVLLCASAFVLSACGGTRLVKNAPPPPQQAQALATAADAALGADLRWVIVRNGPGAWAKDADWDEYLLQVRNQSTLPLHVTGVTVTNSLGQPSQALGRRKALVKASKRTVRGYKDAGLEVKAGRGSATLIASGLGATTAGVGAAAAAVWGGGTAGAGAVAGGLILAGPVLVGAGIVRAVRNTKVGNRIEQRSTALPLTLAPGQALPLDLFFPLSPAPTSVQISYRNAQGEHRLALETGQALAGLHLPSADTDTGTGTAPSVVAPAAK